MVVGIEDVLAIRVIDVIDVPRGTFVLDPYADSCISAHQAPRLAENISRAISELIEHHRRNIQKKHRLPQWPLWAENFLKAELARDPLLEALENLNALCAKAMELDSDILVLGD